MSCLKKIIRLLEINFGGHLENLIYSSIGRHVMRPKFSNMALLIDRGLPDIGYASDMSNSISVGVVMKLEDII